MKLLVLVLNKEELLEDVLTAYVEAGIPGATILDSEGMGRFLTHNIPLFVDFNGFMQGNRPRNKTIFSIVQQEESLTTVKRLLHDICGGFSDPGTGILFTLPVDEVVGCSKHESC